MAIESPAQIWQTRQFPYAIRASPGRRGSRAGKPPPRLVGFHPFDVDVLAQFHLMHCRGEAHSPVVRTVGILVVHRHRLYADTVARGLNSEPGIRVLGIASSGAIATTAVEVLDPDVAVLDMELTDMSSLELTARWSRRARPIAVAAILGCDDRASAVRAIRAGAGAVTTKASPIADLLCAVTALARSECWVPPSLLAGIVREMQRSHPPPNPYDRKLLCLTQREHEILDRMAAGQDRATIAGDLGISVNTVRTHAQNLLGKLGVHSTIEAVSVAHRASRVSLPT